MVLQATMLLCSMLLLVFASADDGRNQTPKAMTYCAGILLGMVLGGALL